MSSQITRRNAIKALSSVGTAAALGIGLPTALAQSSASSTEAAAVPGSARRRMLRIAHLTDVHVQPERRGGAGMKACLHHVQSQKVKPELILTGGDSIMDSFEADDARTQLQWDLWRTTLAEECSLPIHSCIGNHDIWGWNKEQSKTTGNEPNYGKRRAIDMLGMPDRYHTFDRAGWRFIVLDSIQQDGAGYRGFLDEPQFDWLERTLAETNADMPVLVLSHMPIIAASAILHARQDERGDFHVSASLIHQDAIRIKDLFSRYKNVKVCLSGHLHNVDRVDYNGVSYLCNGAVCGNWWKGRYKDTHEGYALIDLFDDGSFEREYVSYGWKVELSSLIP